MPILADIAYYEPWWMQIIKAVVIFAVGLQLIPVALLMDRKVMGRMQNRYGPNRVGPYRHPHPDRRHRQAADQAAVPAAHVDRLAVRRSRR